LTLFLVVLRELLLVGLISGPEVLLALPRALPTALRAVFVALLTLWLRVSGLLLREPDVLFLPPLDRVLLGEALFLRMVADFAPLDTLALLPSLLLLPLLALLVFITASSLPNSLAT